MPDFFYKYLKNRFPSESMVIEWGYNVHDALLRYDYDSNVSMFGNILKGEVGNCYKIVYAWRPLVYSAESYGMVNFLSAKRWFKSQRRTRQKGNCFSGVKSIFVCSE